MLENIVIQLGSFSNHIGSHFWNFQIDQFNLDSFNNEEYGDKSKKSHINHYKLLREIDSNDCVKFYPRAVIVDYAGVLGNTYVSQNDLDNTSEVYKKEDELDIEVISSDKDVEHNCHPYIEYLNKTENNFFVDETQDINSKTFDFENSVNSFVDYFTPEWMPNKQLAFVPNYNYLCQNFNSFNEGYNMGDHNDPFYFKDTVIDKVRHEFEFCDSIENIMILLDWCTGFGGISCWLVDFLLEEINKKCINFYCWNPVRQFDNIHQTYKTAGWTGSLDTIITFFNLFQKLSDTSFASLFLSDFNLNHLPAVNASKSQLPQFNHNSLYLSSALPALALETITSQCRLISKHQTIDCFQLVDSLTKNNSAKPLIDLKIGIPYNIQSLFELDKPIEKHLYNLSTFPHLDTGTATHSATSNLNLYNNVFCAKGLSDDERKKIFSNPERICYTIPTKLPVPITFPQLFLQDTTKHSYDDVELISSLAYCYPKFESISCPVISTMYQNSVNAYDHNYLQTHNGTFEKDILMQAINTFKDIIA